MRTTDPLFNVTFVRIMEQHPCLYAFDSSDYNNRAVQEKAWESVAKEVKESVTDCKERWKNIRGCFTRYLKSVNTPGIGGKKQPYYLAEPLNFLLQYTKSRKPLGEYFSQCDPPMLSLEPTVKLEENGTSDLRDEDGSASLSQDGFSYDQEDVRHDQDDVRHDREFAPPAQKRFKLSREHVAESSYESSQRQDVLDNLSYNKALRDEKKSEESDLAFLTSLLTDMKEMSRSQKRRFKIGILDLAGRLLDEQPSASLEGVTPASSGSSSPAPVNSKS
uniref:Transcription factor Adf-1 n=1 Tax=Lygus hesperus TaxID=30085 RepID=A0A146LXA9_LYGHE